MPTESPQPANFRASVKDPFAGSPRHGFPMLAYMVSEEKIRTTRRLNLLVRFLLAAVALFVEWAVYGLIVLPTLKRAFQAT